MEDRGKLLQDCGRVLGNFALDLILESGPNRIRFILYGVATC